MWGGSRTLVVFSLSVQCTTRGFKPGGMWPSSIVSWMTDSLIDGVKSTASFRSLAAFTRGAIPLGIACGLVASRLRRANLESWSKTNVFRSGESMFSAILKMFFGERKNAGKYISVPLATESCCPALLEGSSLHFAMTPGPPIQKWHHH